MQKIYLNHRIIALAFFTVFALEASAQTITNDEAVINFAYTGQVYGHPHFKLTVTNNLSEAAFRMLIRHRDGRLLFRDDIKAAAFSKSFVVNTDMIRENDLHIELINRQTGALSIHYFSSDPPPVLLKQEAA